MLEEGLREIKNPSSIFTNKENISGVTTTITNEGTRPLAVDIQALVNKTFYSNPRRTTTGISINRLHQILAVIEKHVGIKNIVVTKLEEELNNNFQNLINIKEISNIKEAVDYSLSV